MSKKFLWLIPALIIVICMVFVNVSKLSVTYKSLSDEDRFFIICKAVRVTGFDWKIINENGIQADERYVKLVGEDPQYFLNYDLQAGDNEFVFYGKYIGTDYFDGDEYNILEVSDWDILYPVKRNNLFDVLLPNWCILKHEID